VTITDHELTAASSVVAALAIIGGYLGVRSANRNAVRIAREERSERRKDELNALKRLTYAGLLGALSELSISSLDASFKKNGEIYTQKDYSEALGRRAAATRSAVSRLDELRLISSADLYFRAKEVLEEAGKFEYFEELDDSAYIKAVETLQVYLHADLAD
jgi:hypothetical protein